jgi:hypothetical protein
MGKLTECVKGRPENAAPKGPCGRPDRLQIDGKCGFHVLVIRVRSR